MSRFPEHSNGTFVLSQRVSSFYHDLDYGLGWVWLVDFCLSSNFCEGVRVVRGDEAPIGGVAQVLFHGVRVIEVDVLV